MCHVYFIARTARHNIFISREPLKTLDNWLFTFLGGLDKWKFTVVYCITEAVVGTPRDLK